MLVYYTTNFCIMTLNPKVLWTSLWSSIACRFLCIFYIPIILLTNNEFHVFLIFMTFFLPMSPDRTSLIYMLNINNGSEHSCTFSDLKGKILILPLSMMLPVGVHIHLSFFILLVQVLNFILASCQILKDTMITWKFGFSLKILFFP